MLINPSAIVNQAVSVFAVPAGQTFYDGLENLSVTFQVQSGTATGDNPWNQTATTTAVTITAYMMENDLSAKYSDDAGSDLSKIYLTGHCVSPIALPTTIGFGDTGTAVYTSAGGREYSGRFTVLPCEQEQYAAIETAFGQAIAGLLTITGQD